MLAVIEGTATWQRGMLIAGGVLLLWQAIRGWSLGPARQIVQIAALIAAYLAALLLGGGAVPLLRPVIQLPDIILRVLGGAAVALVVYLVLLGLGALVLKKTDQQPGPVLRLFYGLSGSLLGIVSGCLLLWILLMGVRLIGTVAEARLEAGPPPLPSEPAARTGGAEAPRDPDAPGGTEAAGPPPVLFELAARAKKSVELGPAQPVVEAVDVIPDTVYALLGDLARVVSTPETAQRFLEYPGAAELAADPKIRALQGDPDITYLLQRGSYLALLRNEKIIEAANDPGIAERVRRFELRKAMDHALAPPPPPAAPGAAGAPRSSARSVTGTRAVSSPVPSPRPLR